MASACLSGTLIAKPTLRGLRRSFFLSIYSAFNQSAGHRRQNAPELGNFVLQPQFRPLKLTELQMAWHGSFHLIINFSI